MLVSASHKEKVTKAPLGYFFIDLIVEKTDVKKAGLDFSVTIM